MDMDLRLQEILESLMLNIDVLNIELERVGADSIGAKAKSQLDISGPVLNFAQLAQGMGVHAVRVSTAEELMKALEYAQSHAGPHLIEAIVPESLNGVKRKVLPWLLRSLPSLPLPLTRALKRRLRRNDHCHAC